ncbi:MAG TPA: spore coat U domain-containing protein [Steroidobacteraceae bacterium]|jgi:spore coat protein U-like protein|nr:spore coat U domain-containing protein [Steroidobacteraceae bacterium]
MSVLSFINVLQRFAQYCVSAVLRACVALILMLAAVNAAHAAASCTVSATGPDFGTYDPLNPAPTDAIGSVTATCTLMSGRSETVTLVSSYSTGNSGNFASRSMKSGTHVLSYNLYYDAAHTQIRGDGTGGSMTGSASLSLTRRNPVQTLNPPSVIYGSIPAGQDVPAGVYSDTIVITVTY